MSEKVTGAFWVVPESLETAVQEKIASILKEYPELSPDKEHLRHDLLSVFNEHGHMDVTITPRGKDCE